VAEEWARVEGRHLNGNQGGSSYLLDHQKHRLTIRVRLPLMQAFAIASFLANATGQLLHDFRKKTRVF